MSDFKFVPIVGLEGYKTELTGKTAAEAIKIRKSYTDMQAAFKAAYPDGLTVEAEIDDLVEGSAGGATVQLETSKMGEPLATILPEGRITTSASRLATFFKCNTVRQACLLAYGAGAFGKAFINVRMVVEGDSYESGYGDQKVTKQYKGPSWRIEVTGVNIAKPLRAKLAVLAEDSFKEGLLHQTRNERVVPQVAASNGVMDKVEP